MIDRDIDDGILTLRLAHGKAGALDIELCDALRSEVEGAAEADGVRAIVLTGTGSIFSAGVDLPRLLDSGGDYIERFLESFDAALRALFLFPKPLVVAANGHAVAGGAIMVFASDYRLMSGGRIGVPELQVGVPFPPLALEIVRFAVPHQQLQSFVYLGRTVEADEAQRLGLIDEAVARETLLDRAGVVARQLAGVAPDVFRVTKRQLRERCLHDAAHAARDTVDIIDALWSAPATHDQIRAYLARTIKKS